MALRNALLVAAAVLATPALAQQWDPGLSNSMGTQSSAQPKSAQGDAASGAAGTPTAKSSQSMKSNSGSTSKSKHRSGRHSRGSIDTNAKSYSNGGMSPP